MKIIYYLLMLILMISIVYSSSFISPTQGQEIKDTVLLTLKTVSPGLSECDVLAESTMAGVSTHLMILNHQGNFVMQSIDTTGLKDASDYRLSGKCYDTIGTIEPIEPITGIIIDNTKPTAKQISDQISNWEASDNWEYLCVGVNIATISFAGEIHNMDLIGAECLFDSSVIAEGPYDVTATFSDGKDNIKIAYNNLLLKRERQPEYLKTVLQEELNRKATAEQPTQETRVGWWSAIGILIIGILVIIIGWFGKKDRNI